MHLGPLADSLLAESLHLPTAPALSALLNGRAALSPDMAIRIEKAFGPKMDTLLRMQTAYEIAEARDRAGVITVKRYVPKPTTARGQARPIPFAEFDPPR